MIISFQDQLDTAIQTGVAFAAELLVAQGGKIRWHLHAGQAQTDSLFDLASLTKPLCTALLSLLSVQEKRLSLDSRVADHLPTKTLKDVSVGALLNHSSGLIAWHDFASPLIKKKSLDFDANKRTVLASILRQKKFMTHPAITVYSDLGYMILGAILEKIHNTSLDALFRKKIAQPLGLEKTLLFIPHPAGAGSPQQFVPSEICPLRGKTLQGEVMDENAWIMGGVAGHAGLFGNAHAIHTILSVLRSAQAEARRAMPLRITPEMFRIFCEPNTKRKMNERKFTFGFDTPTKPGSQSGRFFSKRSIGHLGFAGTSFWWDLKKDVWVILLTNRCYPSRENKKILQFRPKLHDTIMRSLISPF